MSVSDVRWVALCSRLLALQVDAAGPDKILCFGADSGQVRLQVEGATAATAVMAFRCNFGDFHDPVT